MVHQTIASSSTSAPSASSKIKPMHRAYRSAGVALLVAACSTTPPPPTPPTAPTLTTSAQPAHPASRWVPTTYAELPGWSSDRTLEAWPALLRGCERAPAAWAAVCAEARRTAPADDGAARAWVEQRLAPFRVESIEGRAEGLITGYFEPLLEARRQPQGNFRTPLHAAPADLATRKPWYTRQQIDTLPAAQAALRGRAIAYVADPLLLQILGSGRLRVTEADGRERLVRLAYAGHNDHPYRSVGRWLVEKGELKLEQASWPAIRAWAERNPSRRNELLWANPRTVFFREEPLPDPTLGPRGAMGVPLTARRSIAVDPQSLPYGTPVWIDTTEPLSAQPLQRLTLAQDTGSAITGAVRADFFWGDGPQAEAQAGRMKQPLRMWVLWPR
jgi:membrane-bound lytic murein transglycosylase A